MPAVDLSQGVPLFPLPNCVLFPHALLPLHIFEPRYRTMMADTLARQSLIAMALLKPGWEKEYYGSPAIYPVVCVGKIAAHEKLPDGKYNLLLQGLCRARVQSETRETYRTAQLECLADVVVTGQCPRFTACRATLAELLSRTPLADLHVAESFRGLIASSLPVWNIADVLAFSLIHDIATRQRLLENVDALQRTEEVIALLKELSKNPVDVARLTPRAPRSRFQSPPGMN